MSKFKVGDNVIGNEGAKRYGITTTGWCGKVVKLNGFHITLDNLPGFTSCYEVNVNPEHFDLLATSPQGKVQKGDTVVATKRQDNNWQLGDEGRVIDIQQHAIKVQFLTGKKQGNGPNNNEWWINNGFYQIKTGGTSTSLKSKPVSQPQAFMEGVDVKIANTGSYYDVMTEDYIGKVGNIQQYLLYDDDEECWLMSVRMDDGEELEVMENECESFKVIKTPSTTKSIPKIGYDPGISYSDFKPIEIKPITLSKQDFELVTNPCTEEKIPVINFKVPTFHLNSSVMKEKVSKVAF